MFVPLPAFLGEFWSGDDDDPPLQAGDALLLWVSILPTAAPCVTPQSVSRSQSEQLYNPV